MNEYDKTEPAIEISRDEGFLEAARSLSDCVLSLPLSNDENDRLIALILRQVEAAERNAYKQGFQLGSMLAKPSQRIYPSYPVC